MEKSRVVILRSKKVISRTGELNHDLLNQLFRQGMFHLTGNRNPKEFFRHFFTENDRIGIKVNTIGGKKLSTRPDIVQTLAVSLIENSINQKNIFVWDRTNRELRTAGYRLNMNRSGIKIFGTDSQNIGYNPALISHLNIGSLFSSIQTDMITASLSLAILKDHGLAGITAGIKNYFGAIHNPNKYHDFNCNPFIAELFDTSPIKAKHRLSILDGIIIQFHRGPAYHAKWNKNYGALIFSTDPVAADYTGWQLIEKLRAAKGLPSLSEEKRAPLYLKTAEKMGLGFASKANIETIEVII